jgi:hypothetical protein
VTAVSPPRAVPETVREDLLAALEVADRSPAADAAALAEALYADWYLAVRVSDDSAQEPAPALGPLDLDLTDLLREAHVDARRWEPGWTVEGVSSQGRVAVTRDGRRRILARVDVLPVARVCLPPRPGDAVRVVARRDALDEASAFWFTYSADWDESSVPPSLVRVYWNVRRRSAPALVGALTGGLAAAGTTYSLKVAVGDGDVDRPDRAVLYLTRDAFAVATPAIRRAHHELAGALLSYVPRLTRRLEPGLALADDPGTGESFGQHRCRLVADAIRGDDGGSADPEGRAATVVAYLAAAGLDPARPYLRPGSDEDHPWPST